MDKAAQRKAALAARRGLTAEQRAAYSRAACDRLTVLPEAGRAKVILSYLALPEELDLSRFHAWARAAGKTLAFPVTGGAGKMEAYVPAGEDALEPGAFGILAPVPGKSRRLAPEELDLVVVPCVAFDGEGWRLGRGGGYYDRYLPRCPQAVKIAAAFEVQQASRVARGGYDAPVDMTVTEAGIYRRPGL